MTDQTDQNPEMVTTQASLATTVQVWWSGIPNVTRTLFAACTSIYLFSLLLGWDNLNVVCLSPSAVIHHAQLWRIVTSAVFHVGLLHIAFNMLAFLQVGGSLERTAGSRQLAWLVALLVLAGSALYIGIAFTVNAAGYGGFLRQCAVGFSGVIFGLIPVEGRFSPATQRSIFGLFSVPTLAYPWVLLILWQVLVPQASFLGHLSGLAVGQVFALRWAIPNGDSFASEPLLPLSWGSTADGGGGGARWTMPQFPTLIGSFFKQESRGDADSNDRGQDRASGSLLGGTPTQLDPQAAAAAAAAARTSK